MPKGGDGFGFIDEAKMSSKGKANPPAASIPTPDAAVEKKKKKKKAAEEAEEHVEEVETGKAGKPKKAAAPAAPVAGPSKPKEKAAPAPAKSATPAKPAAQAPKKVEAAKPAAKPAAKAAPAPAPAEESDEDTTDEEPPAKPAPKPAPKPAAKAAPAAKRADDDDDATDDEPPAKPAAKPAAKPPAKAAARPDSDAETDEEDEEEAAPKKAAAGPAKPAAKPGAAAAKASPAAKGKEAEEEGEGKKRGRAKLTEEQKEVSDRRRKGVQAALRAVAGAGRGKELPFPMRAPVGTHAGTREAVCPYFTAHDEHAATYRASMLALASVDGEHEREWRREEAASERALAEADAAAGAVESRVDEFVERVQAQLPLLRRHCILPEALSKQPPAALVASLLAFVHAAREMGELATGFTLVVNRYWGEYLAPRDEAEEQGPLAAEPNLKVLGKLDAELRELLPVPAGATDLTRAGRGVGRAVAAFHDAFAAHAGKEPAGKEAGGAKEGKKRGRPAKEEAGAGAGKERKKARALTEAEQRTVAEYFANAASEYAAEHPEDPRGCFKKDGEFSGFAPWIYETVKRMKAELPELADVHPGTVKGVGCSQFREYSEAMLAQIVRARAGRKKKEDGEGEGAAAEEAPAKKKKKKAAAEPAPEPESD